LRAPAACHEQQDGSSGSSRQRLQARLEDDASLVLLDRLWNTPITAQHGDKMATIDQAG
jgi:hypothetical protein